MQPRRRVILLVESNSAYGRGCLRGVARYARSHGGWAFYHQNRAMGDPVSLSDLRAWGADGVIARIETEAIAELVRELKLPTVDLRGTYDHKNIPGIYTDHRAVMDIAIRHLRSNGFAHLAFCGFPGVDFSDDREKAFIELCEGKENEKHIFKTDKRLEKPPQFGMQFDRRGVADWEPLLHWLRDLPKPAGIIACNDTRGRQILEACLAIGIKVPYDLAVVGVDNDEVLCELSYPTMTSVAPDVQKIGFEAARVLDALIAGETPEKDSVLIPPTGIELRASSDVTALTDPTLVRAVRVIREKVDKGISVKELLSELPVSRSTFERQFQQYLGCTPYEYILRCRIDRVKELLRNTNYSIAQVTRMTGFRGSAHMAAVFKARTGMTPSKFRGGTD